MRFQTPLVPGRLIRRYKRFLADVALETGATVTAHCPNPGSMMGLAEPGMRVWLEPNDDPKRKLKWGWRLVEHPGGHFTGVDGLPEVIEYARRQKLPDSRFVAGDFVADPTLLSLDDPQIVAISGTLNTMDQAVALELLESCWAAASQALIFNFLPDTASRDAPWQSPPARRLSTAAILDWAFACTWDVQYRQDYFRFGHDGTVLMRKHLPT